jgi:N-acyl-D-aspartate/D-glutamate deacylase
MEQNLKRRGGADSLLIVGGRDPQLIGKRLDAIAKQRNKSPIDSALEIIANGDASVASFNMNDKDIDAFMRQDWVMTGSDGSGGHPRKYGTFPRKIREYVLTKKIISMPFAVRSSSSLTAESLRIPERGRLSTGYFADVIAFDPAAIRDKSTYEQPEVLADGMKFVLVNGKVAVDNGKFTNVLAGRPVKKR